jgi:hypothetical protein
VLTEPRAIQNDPQRVPEPRSFDPDRHHHDTGSLYDSVTGDVSQRNTFVFGAGHRRCQGIHIAERTLVLAIARMTWAFQFLPALDASGAPVQYDVSDYSGKLGVEPREYLCRIVPRSEARVKIIHAEAEECQKLLDPETKQWKSI